jgi:hypothetical protein
MYPAELYTVEVCQFYKVPTKLTKSVVDLATKSPQERLHTINSRIGLGPQGGIAAPVSYTVVRVDICSQSSSNLKYPSGYSARISCQIRQTSTSRTKVGILWLAD